MLKFLQNILSTSKPYFEKGGKLESLYPIFEATDTILFSTDEITESGPHIRDSIDTKRIMILVVMLLPIVTSIACLLYTSPSPRDRTRSRMPSSA